MAVCMPTLPPALVPLPTCQAAASSRTGHGRGRISRLLGEGRNLTWWGQGLRPIWMLWLGIPMALDTLIHTQAHRQAYKHSGHEVERHLTFCFVFEPYNIALAGPKFPGSNVHTLAYQEAGREGTCPQAFSKIHFSTYAGLCPQLCLYSPSTVHGLEVLLAPDQPTSAPRSRPTHTYTETLRPLSSLWKHAGHLPRVCVAGNNTARLELSGVKVHQAASGPVVLLRIPMTSS